MEYWPAIYMCKDWSMGPKNKKSDNKTPLNVENQKHV